MKKIEARTKIFTSTSLRVAIASTLFINLIAAPLMGTMSATATPYATSINLRSESQIRGEAARYEKALSEGKELGRDHNSILNPAGAAALKSRLIQNSTGDGEMLQKVADRLKQAAEKQIL